MTKYKKSDLVDHLAAKVGVAKKQAEDMVEATLDFITSTLKKGDMLTLTGFGSFQAKAREGRTGINPKKKVNGVYEKIQIPASTVPRFKAGKALKEAVNV